MLKLEMESRGWQPDARDQGRICWRAAPPDPDGHVLCAAACWSGHPPADAFARAGWFTPSAWAYRFRPAAVTLWREESRLLAAWSGTTPDFPLHVQGLSRDQAGPETARELHLAELSLRLSGVPVRTACLVWRADGEADTAATPDFRDMAASLGWSFAEEPLRPEDPGQSLPATLVPPPAADRRRRQRDRARALAFVWFTVAVLGLGGFLMARPAWTKESELAARAAALDRIEPELSRLRVARQGWNLLQPALAPRRYPQELLLRCVQQVPDDGIRITQFECTQSSLLVAGEASTPQLAIAFQNRLQQQVALTGAAWDAPSPGFQPDGRASFQIQATFHDVPEQP
jgi:hypothetical protein